MVCPICDESIVDATSHTSGQAAIFCEGLCKEWLHRQCAGLSKTAFDLASQSQDPFFCLHSCLDTQRRELLTLKAATLNEELTAVTEISVKIEFKPRVTLGGILNEQNLE